MHDAPSKIVYGVAPPPPYELLVNESLRRPTPLRLSPDELQIVRREYGLTSDRDADIIGSIPKNQQAIACLLLAQQSDDDIVAAMQVQHDAVQSVRTTVAFELLTRLRDLSFEIHADDGWPPRWPRIGPWWKFWGQPTPSIQGRHTCHSCQTEYRLIWIEDDHVSAGAIDCAECGAKLYEWQSPRQYRAERVLGQLG